MGGLYEYEKGEIYATLLTPPAVSLSLWRYHLLCGIQTHDQGPDQNVVKTRTDVGMTNLGSKILYLYCFNQVLLARGEIFTAKQGNIVLWLLLYNFSHQQLKM